MFFAQYEVNKHVVHTCMFFRSKKLINTLFIHVCFLHNKMLINTLFIQIHVCFCAVIERETTPRLARPGPPPADEEHVKLHEAAGCLLGLELDLHRSLPLLPTRSTAAHQPKQPIDKLM